MRIHAAVVEKPGDDFALMEVELDSPRADEVLVRIEAVGLCHTDIEGQHGRFGTTGAIVLGHEGAGTVEQIGSDIIGFSPGDRVAVSFRSCGTCDKCTAGKSPYCRMFRPLNFAARRPDGSTSLSRDGEPVGSNFFGQSSFATHCITYTANLVKIPDDLPFEIACPMGCGIQTGAGAILNSMDCREGAAVLVLGAGSVGLAAVMAARIRRCDPIIVVEPVASRRELALELGATHVIDPLGVDNLTVAIRSIREAGVDFVLDTSGRADVISAAAFSVAPAATLGLVGMAAVGTQFPVDISMMIGLGLRVVGIMEGDSQPDVFIPQLIQLYRDGQLPVDRLIRTYDLSQINAAVHDHTRGDCIKAVLLPGR